MRRELSGREFEAAADSEAVESNDEMPESQPCFGEACEPSEDSDPDVEELPCTDEDESLWDAFIPDEDERDPEPEAGDFWIEWNQEQKTES